MYICSHQIKLR